jgi:Bacterial SH3 domain
MRTSSGLLVVGTLLAFAYVTVERGERAPLPSRPSALPAPQVYEGVRLSPGSAGNRAATTLDGQGSGQNAVGPVLAARNPHGTRQETSPSAAFDELAAAPPALWAYVMGSSVRVRGTPELEGRVLGSFPRGTRLQVLEGRGRWAKVRDPASPLAGWMHGDYLDAEPPQRVERAPPPSAALTLARSTLGTDEITRRLIAASIASYPGSCPCPYIRDRAGRRCGGRSAYSRAGGYSPLCYTKDITPAMVPSIGRLMASRLCDASVKFLMAQQRT